LGAEQQLVVLTLEKEVVVVEPSMKMSSDPEPSMKMSSRSHYCRDGAAVKRVTHSNENKSR
jgi:hypothetical protein